VRNGYHFKVTKDLYTPLRFCLLMDRILTYDPGLERAKSIIEVARSKGIKPVMGAVYGLPGSGKSHFIYELTKYFERQGLYARGQHEGPHPSTFEWVREQLEREERVEREAGSRPRVLSLSLGPGLRIEDLILYHCAWDRIDYHQEDTGLFMEEDPNFLCETILGRPLDLNVGIFNHNTRRGIRGDYDLVIDNPSSTRIKFMPPQDQ
jgi:hypothetical protein